MDAPYNTNLPMPSSEVMVNPGNPVNPDSKPMAAARIISADGKVYDVFSGVRYEKCKIVNEENGKSVVITNSY